ncbi:MAG: hypothetical protein ACYC8T_13650, partial [Myxococcaceae bacterium]
MKSPIFVAFAAVLLTLSACDCGTSATPPGGNDSGDDDGGGGTGGGGGGGAGGSGGGGGGAGGGGGGAGGGGGSSGCVPKSCTELGINCGPAGDGCGGLLSCGGCTAPQTCGGGGTASVCGGSAACVPQTCAGAAADCGPVADGCGALLDCGTCSAPQTCGGGGTPSRCGGTAACVPRTCASAGASCGPVGDGCGALLDCGSCAAPTTCGGGGQANVCGGTGAGLPDGGIVCNARTCADLGFNCGPAGDGCGNVLACGACAAPDTCGGGGVAGQCGAPACVPKTCAQLAIGCGPAGDGCGNTVQCGTCTAPQTCGGGGTASQCGGTAACVPNTCAGLGIGCGPAGDGCGALLNCGGCTAPQTCGGGGTPSQCGAPAACVPKTCADLGFNCGAAGDGCGGLITGGCGTCTAPAICGGSGQSGRCGDGSDGGSDGGTCTNLCLRQVVCDGGVTTTLTGTVVAGTDPALGFGQPDPIYNALVYVPNGTIKPFDAGVSCDQCGAAASGMPLVTATTGPNGQFTLTDVPTGANVPIVIQLGRWRRQINVTNVPACQTTPLPTTLTRLPRTKAEGDIPLMAISTGNADPIECVLRKMGIADSEFTNPTGTGRVRMYRDTGAQISGTTPAATALYGNATELAKYDMVLFACVASQVNKALADRQRVINYANIGGRVFNTHYSYVWLYPTDTSWSSTAFWQVGRFGLADPVTGYLNTTFPKGLAFSQWLTIVGANSGPSQISIAAARNDNNGVDAGSPVTRWIDTRAPSLVSTQHLTFNTPLGAAPASQCGRVLFSDFHVNTGSGAGTFPAECSNTPLTPQEKVLEFMLFNLSSY